MGADRHKRQCLPLPCFLSVTRFFRVTAVKMMSNPPCQSVREPYHLGHKGLIYRRFLTMIGVVDAIFSLRAGSTDKLRDAGMMLVRAAPPGSRAACRRRDPSDRALPSYTGKPARRGDR